MIRKVYLLPSLYGRGWGWVFYLLLPNKHINRCTSQSPVLANLVLKKSAIVLADVLREVGIEHEAWNLCVRNLVAVLYLDVLTLN